MAVVIPGQSYSKELKHTQFDSSFFVVAIIIDAG